MKYRPKRVVWEITNACNAKCIHCGSKSGKKRDGEMTLEEALQVCDDLAELGCEHVTLIGGELFLSPYWDQVCARLLSHGIKVGPLTNGILLNEKNIKRFTEIGLKAAHLSIDGIGETHDYLRGVPGLFDKIIKHIKLAQKAGLVIGVNTAVSKVNLHQIPEIYQLLLDLDVKVWQVQIVEDLGNACENPELRLTLEDIYQIAKHVARFRKENKLRVVVGDNIGYFTSFEPMIRDNPFTGCSGGRWGLGIESNGNIRGCLAVPGTPETTEGNIRDRSLIDIWNDPELFSIYRKRTVDKLTGFCAECQYRDLCRAGCSSLALSMSNSFYENAYCLHKYELEQGIVDKK